MHLMPLLVRDLTLSLDEPLDQLPERAARRLGVRPDDIRTYGIVRRMVDARRKDRIVLSYNIELALKGGQRQERRVLARARRGGIAWLEVKPPSHIEPGMEPLRERPIIVGFGPAGMLAGLLLARAGYRPLILDRGRDVRTRHRDVMQRFYRQRDFDPESNLLFGEGGAGCYSDGKLYTRVNDPRVREILEIFFEHGAAPDILIEGRPHVGSDRLPTICKRIRASIEQAGGEVRFNARLDAIHVTDGRLDGVTVNGERLPADVMLLAVGHSARDAIGMLARSGVTLIAKPFQLGVRIEHPQELVDRWQYGALCGHSRLPPADYHLIAKGCAATRGDVFSFCMCPGGTILPTNESPGLISTNGASRASRGGPFANSGLVLTVLPSDFADDPLEGLRLAERCERAAFELTGRTYEVPAQRADDYLAGRLSTGPLKTSYPLGTASADVRAVLPPFVAEALARALQQLDARLPGFGGPAGIVTAPETRASAPVRILRDSTSRQSVSVAGLYPVGEGAGYAGGIISAGVDGMHSAEAIIRRHAPLK